MVSPRSCLVLASRLVLLLPLASGCSEESAATVAGAGATSGAGGAAASTGTASGGGGDGTGGNGGDGAGGGNGGGGSGGGQSGRCPAGIVSDPDLQQELPRVAVDVTMPTQTGVTISVAAGGDLQAALDGAALGDTIEIEAGATFVGPFTLPNLSGRGTLIVRTSAADSELPPEGTRIDPSYAAVMPTLLATASNEPALRAAAGAHDVRLIGIQFSTDQYVNALVDLGSGAGTVDDLPSNIVFDRTYFQGSEAEGTRRGLALNSAATAVIDSYFADFKEAGADSQAIGGWSGTGPYLIANNHLEGAGENFLLGGADPSIVDLVPSDVMFCHNLVKKPLSWLDEGWSVKNLFELKNTRRALIAGNVFENNWANAQVGFAILFTVRNQDGGAPWSVVEDITFVRNVVRHVASGINISASDDLQTSLPTSRVLVAHNLIEDIDPATLGGNGRGILLGYGGGTGNDVKLAHNTLTSAQNAFLVFGDSAPVLETMLFVDNVVAHGEYGAFGSGLGEGTAALDNFFTDYTFAGNVVFAGGSAGQYPAGNAFPATQGDVGFADPASGNWGLDASSPYAGTATDGSDPGVDMGLLLEAIAGVE